MYAGKPYQPFAGNRDLPRRKKVVHRYDRLFDPRQKQPAIDYDLRLIILRHGERVDTTLGENWYEQVFGGVPSAPVQSYSHPKLPRRLPHRPNTYLYMFDPPITRAGEQMAFTRGQQLARLGGQVDYCYSSPASRCILTANGLLHGLDRSQVPIRTEPYLFEPLNWNEALRMLKDTPPFMSTHEWAQAGYNIDRRYRSMDDYLNPYETENDYFQRSQLLFQTIERRHGGTAAPIGHGYAHGRRTTVLLVGHAASPIIFPTIASRQPFDAQVFGAQCGRISFLQTVILEREAISRQWNIRPIAF